LEVDIMFTGALSAIVTPFREGAVDDAALRDLIEWQIGAGIQGIVPCGSTGESATLSHLEHEQVIRLAVEQARGRVPVVAGTGSNSTAEAIRLTRFAREARADAALLISPYYNKPTQEGIYKHYEMIARSVDLPLIIYNIPGRTGSNIQPETMARLCEVGNIVGVKEASGSMDQISDIHRLCGDRLTILSGDDSATLPLMALGAKGVISVITNVMPREMRDMTAAALDGDYARARKIHYQMLPLMRALFIETNPIPVKHAMSLLKKCSAEVRLPLTPMSAPAADKLRNVMKEMKLL
jgi:4-hydroxy-tetrahydrodipicolinate synthase